MGSYIFKQPNGKYGRFSSIVEYPTICNCTKEEMIEELLLMERDRIEREFFGDNESRLVSFERMKKDTTTLNITQKELDIIFDEMSI